MSVEVVWQSKPKPFLTVKKNENYFYSERLGKDSVGIVAVRINGSNLEVLLHQEFNPAHEKVIEGAFGGSMDKDKTPMQIALLELEQEGGFSISEDKMSSVGHIFASTQSNEIIHLFVANVTGVEEGERSLEEGEDPWGLQKNNWTVWDTKLLTEIEDPRFVVAMTRFHF